MDIYNLDAMDLSSVVKSNSVDKLMVSRPLPTSSLISTTSMCDLYPVHFIDVISIPWTYVTSVSLYKPIHPTINLIFTDTCHLSLTPIHLFAN